MKRLCVKTVIYIFGTLVLFTYIGHAHASIIKMTGMELQALQQGEIKKIRLYSRDSNGGLQSIPFQVDEKITLKKHKGRVWALDQQGNGRFDADEWILFRERDGGKALDLGILPPAKMVFEISLRGGRKVYLTYEDKPLPLSPKNYVNYQSQGDRIKTDYYEVGFSKKFPLIQNFLSITNGDKSGNILDRFKARFRLHIKPFFRFNFDEEGILSKLVGVRTGPIRVMRRVTATKRLGAIKVVPTSQVDFVYYPTWIEVPTKIKNPIHGPKFLKEDTEGVSGFDFNRNISGSLFYTNLKDSPFRLQGSKNYSPSGGRPVRWWSFSGPYGSMIVGIKNDSKLEDAEVFPVLILRLNPKVASPPEGQVGENFIGFDLPYHRIPKGKYYLLVKQVYPEKFIPGMESKYLRQANLKKSEFVRYITQ